MRQVENDTKVFPSRQLRLLVQLSKFEILYHKNYKLVYHSYVRAPRQRVCQFLLQPLLLFSKVYCSATLEKECLGRGFRKCRE